MSPLERACRALCKLDSNPENIPFGGAPMWQSYMPNARAVLEAVREPSEKMVNAVPDDRNQPIHPDDIWQAMIDAALQQG